jgi:hypothetical protein
MIVWAGCAISRPETGKTEGLAAPLLGVAFGGALLVGFANSGPLSRPFRMIADWIGAYPNASGMLTGALLLTAVVKPKFISKIISKKISLFCLTNCFKF